MYFYKLFTRSIPTTLVPNYLENKVSVYTQDRAEDILFPMY